MAKTFGKSNTHAVEIGHQQSQQADVDSYKYRILCVHVHIVALACAMVGACYHIILSYEDLKKERYYRLIRHAPCAVLFILVIIGNRLYKPMLYLFYLIFNFLFVAFIIIAEIVRQYRIRSDPELLKSHPRRSILFYVVFWTILLIAEICIYYCVYRDYRFVKDVQSNPPKKVQSIRHRNQAGAVNRY